MDNDDSIQRAVAIGQKNKETIELVQNWCAHLTVERPAFGGVGMVEMMTGLPIGLRHIKCPYANAAGFAGMDIEYIALDFYDRNCKECKQRHAVRLPNLLQLVEQRDREVSRHEDDALRKARVETEAIAKRGAKRNGIRVGRDSSTTGIIDIIDRLDRAPNEKDLHILIETARTVPEKFDTSIQELLFEVADAGGHIRTEAAIGTIEIVTDDKTRLCEVALRSLERLDAIQISGSIVSKWLDASHEHLLPPALPAIIHLSSPPLHRFGMSVDETPGRPESLLASYHLFPGLVSTTIRNMVHMSQKRDRIHACMAVSEIIREYPEFGPEIAEELANSVGLADDYYDEGPASAAVANVLAEIMMNYPEEIDSLLQKAMGRNSDDAIISLFRTYTNVLRFKLENKTQMVSPAHSLSFKRVVEALTKRVAGHSLQDAINCIRYAAKDYPIMLEQHIDTLFGALALIADEVANPYSPLLDVRPDPVKAIEAQTRQMHLHSASDAIIDAIGVAALRKPSVIGNQVVQILKQSEDKHEWLRSALVKCLGAVGKSHEGLPVILPSLYDAMMDRSQIVRAAAVSAYGEIGQKASADLPVLFHESALVLLLDSYVIVHSAAVKAMRRVRLPEELYADAINKVLVLIGGYSQSRDSDRILSDCIKLYLALIVQMDALTAEIADFVISVVSNMQWHEAADLVRSNSRVLQIGCSYPALVVKLLQEPELLDDMRSELVDELGKVRSNEIHVLSESIKRAAAVCTRNDVILANKFLEILTAAGAWATAVEVASVDTSRYEDTLWDRPRKLRSIARQIAAELECAVWNRNAKEVLTCVQRWKNIVDEIEKDDEENKEARNPVRGI